MVYMVNEGSESVEAFRKSWQDAEAKLDEANDTLNESEDALKGTKIRGCMMVKADNPAIYLTKLYKDKASFYFALYHELGHIKSDYNKAKSKIIIDEDERLEKRADLFAINTMIDFSIWKEIVNDKDNVVSICEKYNIPVCFATSRLAKEGYIDYASKLYNNYREKI